MGLLDVLNGMQNGPRGQQDPNAKGGMSPITMAILALLAYKGIKHVTGGQQHAPSAPAPSRIPDGRTMDANAGGTGGGLGDLLGGLLGGGQQAPSRNPGGPGGGLGDILGGLLGGGGRGAPSGGGLGGLLGGALAGGTAGSILNGGLGSLLEQFQQNGQGQAAASWVGKGPNQDISESDLARSIGSEDIEALASHTGLSRNELLAGLSRELPGAIDQLTPNGRLPTDEEASRWV
ncbi:MAG TPA: YidB family protein [Xanthobacteraceae bacterium]